MEKKLNQIVGSRFDRDMFDAVETLAYTSATELDAATIAEWRKAGYDYLEIQDRENEEDEYSILDYWSDDGSEESEADEEAEECERCVVCGDDSADWLPVWNGGNAWERRGTAYHCGRHTESEVSGAYAKALDEEARAAGYANTADMENPEGDEI